jgi:hypothetical protein
MEITETYGFVKRARFCYLYTQSGKRLTDMYLEAGRAVLGWRGSRADLAFKNAFSRGMTGTFYSQEARRLKDAVKKLFCGAATVRWYTGTKAESFMALAKTSEKKHIADEEFFLWKPWQTSELPPKKILLFLPPFPLAYDTIIVAAPPSSKCELPASDILPPCVLSGIVRSIYDLIAEIPLRTEKHWAAHDRTLLAFWERSGAYLFPKIARSSYEIFASACLTAGVVISPDYDIPSIVPWSADKGDFSALCSKVKSLYIV